jgi:hypothetical protein
MYYSLYVQSHLHVIIVHLQFLPIKPGNKCPVTVIDLHYTTCSLHCIGRECVRSPKGLVQHGWGDLHVLQISQNILLVLQNKLALGMRLVFISSSAKTIVFRKKTVVSS